MCGYAIWCIKGNDGKLHIGAGDAHVRIPRGAEIITFVEACDLRIMCRWLGRRAKRGWTLDRLRKSCE